MREDGGADGCYVFHTMLRMNDVVNLRDIDACLDRGDPAGALALCDAILSRLPDSPAALSRRGAALLDLDRPVDARRAFNKMLNEDPSSGTAWNGLGKVFHDLGDLNGAADAFGRAAAMLSRGDEDAGNESASARYHQSMALLAAGNFASGWPAHEARLDMARMGYRDLPQPRWTGEPLKGRRLLVLFEQGYGDMMQFARYLPRLCALDGEIIIEMPTELIPLLSRLAPDATIIATESKAADIYNADLAVWLMSLPGLLGTRTIADIPADTPYIDAPVTGPPAVAHSVGLVWAGRSTHPQDRQRSMNGALLAPLLDTPGVEFQAIQREGDISADLALRFARDRSGDMTEFSATAAIVASLGLVITVDTAIAHLAGAMGRPVWVMLPFAADWRWFRDRADSPWYPTMRLFRQDRPGHWPSMVDEVAAALAKWRAGIAKG